MRTFIVALAGLALAGCATSDDEPVNLRETHPDLGKGDAQAGSTTGRLDVRSDVLLARDAKDTLRTGHPVYVVYDEEGRRVAEGIDEPTDLPPGRYLVKVDRQGDPAVFWVTLEPGQVTRVDVDDVLEAR
jgi:hypothetical protein